MAVENESFKTPNTQEEALKLILKLKEENPEFEIHFCIDSDQLLEYGWTAHKISKVEVCPWFEDGERIYTEEEEIIEHFEDFLYNSDSEKSLEEQIDILYKENVKTAICVHTFPG